MIWIMVFEYFFFPNVMGIGVIHVPRCGIHTHKIIHALGILTPK